MDTKADQTTADRVQLGIDIFGRVETALRTAADGMLELRELFEVAYVAGDIPNGDDTIGAMDTCLEIAGDVGAVKGKVMMLHATGKMMADDLGADIATPYAELAERRPRKEGAPAPRSGGGR